MDSTAQKLLACKLMGLVLFDRDLKVLDMDGLAKRLLHLSKAAVAGCELTEFIPEFIGSEPFIRDVLEHKSDDYRLDCVNRHDADGQTNYLNLLVIADGSSGGGFLVVEDITERARVLQELNQQRYELLLFKRNPVLLTAFLDGSILGQSQAIRQVRETIHKLSRVPNATVLLQGESGTGKNLAARVIHYSSMPAEAPFVDINCAALPENLIESELFGYVKGAFTHATGTRAGLMEEANGGTVFLDEIGDLPLNMQAKLLSVLETKKIRRLGSNKTIELKARIIAATNRDLEQEVQENRFRADLFFRLNVVSLTMPPLRDLGPDISLIADHLIKVFNIEFKKKIKGFTRTAREVLLGYPWPGNVRELSNCIERAMIFVESDLLDRSDLLIEGGRASAPADPWTVPPEGVDFEEVGRLLIVSALERAGGNKSQAARLLGLTRDTLRYRMEKYSLG